MNFKTIEKDGFEVYSLIYPAHRRVIILDGSQVAYHKFPDIYFIVLKKDEYLKALLAYKYIAGNFYSLVSDWPEVCLPHKIYSQKYISAKSVLDSFFLSNFFLINLHFKDLSIKKYTLLYSSFDIRERVFSRFPSFTLKELFDHA